MQIKKFIKKDFSTYKQAAIYWFIQICSIILFFIPVKAVLFPLIVGGFLAYRNLVKGPLLPLFLYVNMTWLAIVFHMIAKAYASQKRK